MTYYEISKVIHKLCINRAHIEMTRIKVQSTIFASRQPTMQKLHSCVRQIY